MKSAAQIRPTADHSSDDQTKYSGGELGWIERGSIDTEWEVIVFAMNKGEVRGPITGPRGLHVFQVTEVERNQQKPFAQMKEQLRNEIVQLEQEIRGLQAQQDAKTHELELVRTEHGKLKGLADKGLIEAARAMGATPMQIVFKVLLAEARPALTLALTMTAVSLIGYSAMVGAVGGGGLGDLGIRYGYQRFMPDVMLVVVIVLIVLVQLVQSAGDGLARRFDKKNRKT